MGFKLSDYITKQQLADRHKVKIRTVDHWIRTKKLPFLKFGKDIVFKEEELEKWGKEEAVFFAEKNKYSKR